MMPIVWFLESATIHNVLELVVVGGKKTSIPEDLVVSGVAIG